ncbi:Peroxisome biogenesis protein 1 [Forsythia ovata]|uniref:Peroxisome biogenesis protein 1 n=1 Tax=Forsythia ovata TaxID=205694 RepID=A0ABD1VNV4_9LAMI
MEFEVRAVGGIESCYISLPLSLIQTLQSGYLPPILAVELRSGTNLWHVAWSGSLSSSSPSSIEIAKQYAECIGLSDRTVVKVRIVSNLLKATLVTVEPLTEDDWEILELNSELAEESILKQVGIVHEEMKFPLWLHGQTIVNFLVVSTFPKKPVVQLVPGTEVAVAPKRRKRILYPLEDSSIPALEGGHSITKALLRVQDPDTRFLQSYKVDDIKMDVVFTSAVFIHPATAKNYSFSSYQLVVISPRSLIKEKKNRETEGLLVKSSSTEKEVNNGILADKHDNHQAFVRLLFSESVARGHVMLAQSLRLYLGAGLHSWVHMKRCNVNVKKDIPLVSLSPCQLKSFPKNETFENNGAEFQNGHKNHKTKDVLLRTNTNAEMVTGGWSSHEKIFASLFAESCGNGTEETVTKAGTKRAVSTLVRAWCQAQLDSIVSSTGVDVNSLVIGNKTLLHLKVKGYRLGNHGKVQKPNGHFPKTRNQTEAPDVDVLYVLSLSEDSLHGESFDAYELVFDEKSGDKSSLRNLDVLLEKLQLGDAVSIHAVQETPI